MMKYMKKYLLPSFIGRGMGVGLLLFAFLAWSCSSDSNDAPEAPQGIAIGNDQRPDWQSQAPNYDLFGQTMYVEILVQDTLKQYVSANDLMVAMIDNEVRGVALPLQVGDEMIFPIMVASDNAGDQVSLSYYCDKLHRIFTIDWTRFDANVNPTGEDGIYKPEFIK